MCEEFHSVPQFLDLEIWIAYRIAWLQCVMQWINYVRSSFEAKRSRTTAASAAFAVCNVWTITTTSLGVRVIIGTQSVVTWHFWPFQLIWEQVSFGWADGFSSLGFVLFHWPTILFCMARFFAVFEKSSEILFHFGFVWITGCIDLVIFNHNADFIQIFSNFRETWVSGVGWCMRNRFL